MILVFFGDEALCSDLKGKDMLHPKLITSDEDECRDWLENNQVSKVYLLFDHDAGKKKVDKFILNLRNEFPELVAILLHEELRVKDLKKHQSGKFAADGYIKKPLSAEKLTLLLEDLELGAFISRENLLEEGVQLPPIPELGSEESASTDIRTDEEGHSAQAKQTTPFEGDPVNQGIQDVFDHVIGETHEIVDDSSYNIELSDSEEDELLEDDDEFLDEERGESSDSSIDVLNLEEEEEINIDDGGLSFDFQEEESVQPHQDEEQDDATKVVGSDMLAMLAKDTLETAEDEGSEKKDTGESSMSDDDLFDDDLEMDAPEEVDKTVVENYDLAEGGGDILPDDDDLMELEELSEETELGDIGLDGADDLDEFSSDDSLEFSMDDDAEISLDNDSDELSLEDDLAEDSSEENLSVSSDLSEEHNLPADEDLEFPSLSTMDTGPKAASPLEKGEFEIDDFDEDSVDQTLSEIVKTDKVSTEKLSDDDDEFAPLDDDIITSSSLSNEEDFEIEEDSQLIDLDKIDLTNDDIDAPQTETPAENLEFESHTNLQVIEKKEEPVETDEGTLQFDSSTEQTSENLTQIQPRETVEETTANEDETTLINPGLVFDNVQQEESAPSSEAPLETGIMTEGERKLLSGHHESELMRLQVVIRQLREEREELLDKVKTLEADKKIMESDNLSLQAENDEMKIELEIIRKRHRDELEELKYRNRISEEKKLLAQEKTKKLDRELNRLQQRIHIDLNKVRQREKELESKLELAMIDSDSQVKARDKKIIELKRKIDQLEFNMENVAMKEQQSRTEKHRIEERLGRIMKTLRGSIELLEDDIQFDNSENKED